MSGVEFQPQFHPAGFDGPLRLALDDVRADRWRSMRDLLDRTGSDWELRTARSQVLAAAAAKGDAVEAWRQEEPHGAHVLMMLARVAVQRALNAHRAGQPDTWRLEDRARQACWAAANHWREDPVPWVGLLALAALDAAEVGQRRPEHRMPPPEALLPYGPWGLLAEASQRDPYNREVRHRMLQALQAYGENAFNYARWVASWAPQGSALLVLPLYVHAEVYRSRRANGKNTALYWVSDAVSHHADRALHRWFAYADPAARSPLDLNHLAQALYSSGANEGAEVFAAIGSCATPTPWTHIADDPKRWVEDFLRARRYYLDPVVRPLHAGPRR